MKSYQQFIEKHVALDASRVAAVRAKADVFAAEKAVALAGEPLSFKIVDALSVAGKHTNEATATRIKVERDPSIPNAADAVYVSFVAHDGSVVRIPVETLRKYVSILQEEGVL